MQTLAQRRDGTTLTRAANDDCIFSGPRTRTKYQYDGNNQLKNVTYPSGRVVTYGRWPNGRIKTVTAVKGVTTTPIVALADYTAFGPVQSIGYGNGMTQLRLLGTDSYPSAYSLFDATNPLYFDNKSYTVNDAGNITKITDLITASNTRNYDYDNLDRLVWDSKASATNPTYTYDANGNRLSRAAGTYAAQTLNYVANSNRAGSSGYYDGMGNSTSNNSQTYNAAGRLDHIAEPGNTQRLDLNYNGMGELARTVETLVDGCTGAISTIATDDFVFVPDGRALYLRTTNSVAIGTEYVWLDDLPVAQFQDSYDSGNNVISTQLTYLHDDHLNTPRVGTSPSRQIMWSNPSDAFGIPALSWPAVVRLRAPGQLSLGIAGVNYNYYRDYDPHTGRYLESDPIGLRGGLNTYAYVHGNPVKLVDPLGLIPPSPQVALAEAIATGNIQAIETLTAAGEISSAAAERAILEITIKNRSTGSVKQLADLLNRNRKAIEDAIHSCKQNLPRNAPERNPDVVVDKITGEVYPLLKSGRLGDSIGNILDALAGH